MLTNEQMKANRYQKLYNGKKTFNAIINQLQTGGDVFIVTYTRAVKYKPQHINMFRLGKSGSVYVQRGKKWDCIDYCGIKFN